MILVHDILATAVAVVLFGLCVLPLGWLATRRLALAGDGAAWTVLLGTALTTLVAALASRFLGMAAAWAMLAGTAAVAALSLLRAEERRALAAALAPLADRRLLIGLALWLAGGWLVIADIQVGGGLSLSGVLVDYAKHVSVTDAISRTGVPPVNPNYYPEQPLPLFYYYYWFLLCSLVDQLGGDLVTAKHAVFAGTLWGGGLLLAALRLYAGTLDDTEMPASRRTAIAAALLLVTGLDLLPFVAIHLNAAVQGLPGPMPDLEWWNEQVTAWLAVALWVPHHLGALAICLAAFLLLNAAPPDRQDLRWSRAAVAGLIFTASLGTSIWVTMTAAVIAAAWCAVLMVWGERATLAVWIAAGTVAALTALPYIQEVAAARQGGNAAVALGIREFFPLTRADRLLGIDIECGQLCRLAVLPLNYVLEFGFFALAGILYWRRHGWPKTSGERFLLTAALAALAFCSVVKANVAANDLGWRGLMFTQFALLLWAAPLVAEIPRRPLLRAAAILGLGATLIQVVQLRAHPADPRDADLRRTYEWLASHTAEDAILQHNPAVMFEPLHALYGNRQAVFSDWLYGALYGIGADDAKALQSDLATLFASPALPSPAVADLAGRYHITHLVAKAEDPVWSVPDSWVWQSEPVFATTTTRVVAVADLERPRPGAP